MKPTVDIGGLKKGKPWEYAVRFAFGGVVTALAGVVSHAWGPGIGGLMLAFPAIFPASLTMVKQHDGRAQAIDDARGGRLGSVGLAAFGLVIWIAARAWPPAATLAAATVTWATVNAIVWWALHRKDPA